MEKWKIYFTWRDDANKGAEKRGVMEVTACCINQALSEYERRRPVNARVCGVWAASEEEREGK